MHSSTSSNMIQESDPLEGAESGVWRSKDGRLSCGFLSFMGKRFSMEDRYDIREEQICTEAGTEAVYLFGIFDGHGGAHAAEYLKEHLFVNLIKHPNFITATVSAIRETYNKTDGDFLRAEINSQRDDGSTASTAILIGNHLYIANVGDSRAVISKAGEAVQLSDDHKPNRTDERKRIENAGGVVMWAGTWRVGGVLAMSRAFGDRLLKQFVVADPEIRVETVDERLEYLVVASDGLWDSVSNEEAMKVVASESRLDVAARNLTKKALSGGSGDNITCIVVKFHHNATTVPNTTPGESSPADSLDHQSIIPFPPRTAVDSSSAGTAGSSVGGVYPLLHTNAACSSTAGLDSLLPRTTALSSATSTDPVLHTMSVGPLSAGSTGSSAADSTSSGSIDSLLNRTGADSTLAVSLDTTMPMTRDYPSADTTVFPQFIDAAGTLAGGVDSTIRPSI